MTHRADTGAEPATWHERVDRGALLAARRRPDGTLLLEGYAAREGVLEYRNADGTIRRELVPAATLAASASGLARLPVTLEHPRGDVTPDNVAKLGVGDTDGEVRVEDGGYTRVRMAVRRRDAIDAIGAGKRELSPGYKVRLDESPGVHPEHGRYDAVQVERTYNHLAIVDSARGGRTIAVRADAAVATTVIDNPSGARSPIEATVNPRFLRLLALLGLTSRVDSDDAAIDAASDALQARKDSAERADTEREAKLATERAAAATALATATARGDTEKARADRAEADLATMKAAEAKRVDAATRLELEAVAGTLGIADAKAHADTKALKRAIAGKHLGSEVKADAEDAYIDALVDLARKDGAARSDGRKAGREAWTVKAAEGGAETVKKKPDAMRSRWDNAGRAS